MINVLLDELPAKWTASDGCVYALETDFRIGVQICLMQSDPELTRREKTVVIQHLLFADKVPPDMRDVEECMTFFINGWFHDNEGRRKTNKRLMDFDVDQWRIYSAFLAQYHIDLNTVQGLHFWAFMGLLSALDECAYTRVVDIRQRKFRPKMDAEEKRKLKEAKAVYELPEILSLEEKEEEESIYDFLGGTVSESEQKRIDKFEKYADMDEEG